MKINICLEKESSKLEAADKVAQRICVPKMKSPKWLT